MINQQSRVRTERVQLSPSDFQAELIKLSPTSETKKILIYGDSNAGKTVLAGTTPGRCLWLAGEPGYKSAARKGATGYVRRISDTAMAWAAIDWLEENRRYSKFNWVIVDGLTTMQERFRLGYAQEAYDINPTKRAHRNLPDRPDYFNTQNIIKTWIGRLVDLPVNLLITCHAYRTESTDGNELLVFPGIQGKVTEVANTVSGLMDVTAYYEARRLRDKTGKSKIVRRLWFESPERKTRQEDEVRYICGEKFGGVLGSHMDFPTMPRLLKVIDGETVNDESD